MAGIKDGRVLYSRRNNVITFSPICKKDSLERMIVRFASPAGKNDFRRVTAEERGNLSACFLDGIPGGMPAQ